MDLVSTARRVLILGAIGVACTGAATDGKPPCLCTCLLMHVSAHISIHTSVPVFIHVSFNAYMPGHMFMSCTCACAHVKHVHIHVYAYVHIYAHARTQKRPSCVYRCPHSTDFLSHIFPGHNMCAHMSTHMSIAICMPLHHYTNTSIMCLQVLSTFMHIFPGTEPPQARGRPDANAVVLGVLLPLSGGNTDIRARHMHTHVCADVCIDSVLAPCL